MHDNNVSIRYCLAAGSLFAKRIKYRALSMQAQTCTCFNEGKADQYYKAMPLLIIKRPRLPYVV